MPWTKKTAPKSRRGERAPYEKRRERNYLNCEVRKRDGKETSRHFFVRIPIPRDLRARFRREGHKSNTVVRYLKTGDAKEARELAPGAVAAIRAEFEAKRRPAADPKTTLDALRHVRDVFRSQAFDELAEGASFEELSGNADVAALLKTMGITLDKRNGNLAAFVAQWGEALAQERIENRAGPPAVPAPWRRPASNEPVATGGTIADAADEYCGARDVKVTDKTRHQMKQSARLFADHLDGLSVGAVTRKHAVGFLDRLAAISPKYRHDPKAAKFTLAELETKYPAGDGEGLSTKTLNRHATALRTLFDRLKARDVLPLDHANPFEKTHRRKNGNGDDGTYLPMRDEEIAALLKAAPLAKTRAETFNGSIGWLITLGAYTGARAGELLALTKDDVRRKDGITFIAIAKGKTKNARRFVPIHSALIAAGFLKYAAKCNGRLFGIDAATLAKRFPTFRRNVFKVAGIKERDGVVFHSLRKSFVAKLEHAGYTGDQIAPLVGHAGGARSFTLDIYNPEGPTLNQRALVVEKIVYRGVKLAS